MPLVAHRNIKAITRAEKKMSVVTSFFLIPGGSRGSTPSSCYHFSTLGLCSGIFPNWQHSIHSYNGMSLFVRCVSSFHYVQWVQLFDNKFSLWDLNCVTIAPTSWRQWISLLGLFIPFRHLSVNLYIQISDLQMPLWWWSTKLGAPLYLHFCTGPGLLAF